MAQLIESAIVAAAVGKRRDHPVCLEDIIRDLGARISYAYCRDGFTHFQRTGPVIYLSNRGMDEARRRFVLAHEIGHVMLRRPAVLQLLANYGRSDLPDDEEEMANRIAGALLVPDSLIDEMRESRLTLARLRYEAYWAGITIPMLIARVERAGIDVAVLHWRRGKDRWHVVDRPGVPEDLDGRIEISRSASDALDLVGSKDSTIIVDCRVSGARARIEGKGYRWGKSDENVFQFLLPRHNHVFTVPSRTCTDGHARPVLGQAEH